jgi:hypothetical protein
MKKLLFSTIILLSALIIGSSAQAFEIKVDNSINLNKEEIADGNVYASCSDMKIDGTVNGDIIALCKSITINGVINGDLIAFAQDITINGEIKGNARIAGTNLVINGSVGRNVNIFGSEINLTPNSKVAWDVLVSGVNGQFNGVISGNLHGGLASASVAGKISKNVDLKIEDEINGNLLIDQEAIIGGNLNYQAGQEAVIESASSIIGSTTKQDIKKENKNIVNEIANIFYKLAALILIGLVLISLKKKSFSEVSKNLETKNLQANLIGFGFLILMPLLIIILAITLVGLPLAMILLCAYIILVFLSIIFASFWLGETLVKLVTKKELHPVISLSAGLTVFTLFSIIPYFGWALSIVAIINGLGALLITIKSSFYD